MKGCLKQIRLCDALESAARVRMWAASTRSDSSPWPGVKNVLLLGTVLELDLDPRLLSLHTPVITKIGERDNNHPVPSVVFVCARVSCSRPAALLVYRVICPLYPLPDAMKGRVEWNSLHHAVSLP